MSDKIAREESREGLFFLPKWEGFIFSSLAYATRGRESLDFHADAAHARALFARQEASPDEPDSGIGRAVLHTANDTARRTTCIVLTTVYRFFDATRQPPRSAFHIAVVQVAADATRKGMERVCRKRVGSRG